MYEDEDLQEIHEDIIELNEDISTLRRDLDNISASIEGSGENVTLSQTVEARFKKAPLPMGNSEQVQYSGKQLLPITNQNVTLGGVTFKAVNGRLILNGAATENINGSYFLTDNFKVSLGSGNYVLSRTNVNSNLTIMLMLLDGTVVAPLPRTISDLSVSLTIASANNYYIAFYIPAGSTFNNYDSGVMVSTTGGAYEPYVRSELQVHHQTIHKK